MCAPSPRRFPHVGGTAQPMLSTRVERRGLPARAGRTRRTRRHAKPCAAFSAWGRDGATNAFHACGKARLPPHGEKLRWAGGTDAAHPTTRQALRGFLRAGGTAQPMLSTRVERCSSLSRVQAVSPPARGKNAAGTQKARPKTGASSVSLKSIGAINGYLITP